MLCLTQPTSARWVEAALADLDAVLVDHAHCEMKAASNALSLAVRASQSPQVVGHLVSLAEEELSHFRRVLGELERRGIPLGPPPLDAYPADLHALYQELLAAEARHFRTFVDLAHEVAHPSDAWVDVRLDVVAALEGE